MLNHFHLKHVHFTMLATTGQLTFSANKFTIQSINQPSLCKRLFKWFQTYLNLIGNMDMRMGVMWRPLTFFLLHVNQNITSWVTWLPQKTYNKEISKEPNPVDLVGCKLHGLVFLRDSIYLFFLKSTVLFSLFSTTHLGNTKNRIIEVLSSH